jgi:acyl carrier protein
MSQGLRVLVLLDRVELMLAIEDKFAGVEITDDDVEQIQVVGDLVQHLNIKRR